MSQSLFLCLDLYFADAASGLRSPSLCVFPSLSLPDIYIFLALSKILPYNECVRGSHEELTMKNAGEASGLYVVVRVGIDGDLPLIVTNQHNDWPLWCQRQELKEGPMPLG